jgi:IS30 family transposase
MEQDNSTTNHKKYVHLSESKRYKIEALLESKMAIKQIASVLGCSRSTLHREITRGTIKRFQHDWTEKKKYRANAGQADYLKKCRNRKRSLKIAKDKQLEEHIRMKITRDHFSPDAVIGEIKITGVKFQGMICTKTLYNYIDAGILCGISHKDLWEKGRRKKRRYKTVVRVTTKNRRARSIEDRPKEIGDRLEYGNWEGDTVKGCRRGSKAGLLTLTERKTREEIILKIQSSSHEAIQTAFDGLEQRYGIDFKTKFKSITFDNGSEFLGWESLEASVLKGGEKRTVIYFAHTYSSWERGTNENHNRMIRRFILKGLDIDGFSEDEIKRVEDWMNNYPRRILGYNTPNQAAENCLQGNRVKDLGSVAL